MWSMPAKATESIQVQVRGVSCGSRVFFFSSRRRHTRFDCDWSSDVCSSDLDHAAAEDCVQETYLRAFRAWPRWKANAPVGAWLHRIAINVAVSHRRKERLRDEIGRASCRERV